MKTEEKIVCFNVEKFDSLLLALSELTRQIEGKEKFRVILEKNPDSQDATVCYSFE